MRSKLHKQSFAAFVLLNAFSLVACAHKPKEDAPLPLSWGELTMVTATSFEPSPDVFLEDIIVSDYNLARLPQPLRGDHDLAKLVLSRGLQDPISYNKGAFGIVGSSKMYVTTTDRVRTPRALYGVIMRVLSEKYGCFLTSRVKSATSYRFYCRDRRQIVLQPTRGDDWVQFHARQYDAEGYEIKVENRRIVRISDDRVLQPY